MQAETSADRQSESPLDYSTGAVRLVAGRCRDCATVLFPLRGRCTTCGGKVVEPMLLSAEGRLWAWTVQRFMPPSPPYVGAGDSDFAPFPVGYIELDGLIRVESRLEAAEKELRVGLRMKLVPFALGDQALFAFVPRESEERT